MTDFSNTTAPCIQTCNSIANETRLANSMSDKTFPSMNLSYQLNSFWNNYELIKSLGNGHCFIHSVVVSYNSQIVNKPSINGETLLNSIIRETISNSQRYVNYYDDECFDVLFSDMRKYVDHKQYNSLFGDIVLLIVVTVLQINIIIVEMDQNIIITTKITCPDDVRNCDHIYISKSGEYYDAIAPKQKTAVPSKSDTVIMLSSGKWEKKDNFLIYKTCGFGSFWILLITFRCTKQTAPHQLESIMIPSFPKKCHFREMMESTFP